MMMTKTDLSSTLILIEDGDYIISNDEIIILDLDIIINDPEDFDDEETD